MWVYSFNHSFLAIWAEVSRIPKLAFLVLKSLRKKILKKIKDYWLKYFKFTFLGYNLSGKYLGLKPSPLNPHVLHIVKYALWHSGILFLTYFSLLGSRVILWGQQWSLKPSAAERVKGLGFVAQECQLSSARA